MDLNTGLGLLLSALGTLLTAIDFVRKRRPSPATLVMVSAPLLVVVVRTIRTWLVKPAGIPSGEAFGTPSLSQTIQPSGIPSAEQVGYPNIRSGPPADNTPPEPTTR